MDRDREFAEYVEARALTMRRTAFLLCGDWHRAEDVVQSALIKLYVAWSRVRKDTLRVQVYGTVDELNSQIGVALAIGLCEKLTGALTRARAACSCWIR